MREFTNGTKVKWFFKNHLSTGVIVDFYEFRNNKTPESNKSRVLLIEQENGNNVLKFEHQVEIINLN